MRSRFEAKTVVVFGGGSLEGEGSSNGKASACAYAAEGATVAVVDLDLSAAENTLAQIESDGGAGFAVSADVTSLASLREAVDGIVAQTGRIDVLHNNVGVTHMGGPVELNEEDFEKSIALNLGSVYRTSKVVIPHMLERGGAIVNISSLASIRYTGYPYFAYYAAKAGVNQATVALAMQYARDGIRANCIIPGAIDSPLIYRQIADQFDSVEDMVRHREALVPLGVMGEPSDVANAALFLASDDAKFVTGVCLPVDGGQSCATQPLTPMDSSGGST